MPSIIRILKGWAEVRTKDRAEYNSDGTTMFIRAARKYDPLLADKLQKVFNAQKEADEYLLRRCENKD